MAVFSNQATLTYTGGTLNSNVAFGEILDVLTVSKTAVDTAYAPNDLLTYVVTIRNTGTTPITAVQLTDDLGGYVIGGNTVYPLTPIVTSVKVFADGVLQTTPTVNAGSPLIVSGISVPAGGDVVVVYQAEVNTYANTGADGSILNTATVTGGGLTAPISATATVNAQTASVLTITKSISPSQVVDNDRVTYTFVIQNSGNSPVTVADATVLTDTFDPILTALTVTLDGAPFTAYTYEETTGVFATTAGSITVPAATVTQDPVTGVYTHTDGTTTLTVTGTI